MEISTRTQAGITIVEISGKLEGTTAQGAYDQILPLVLENCKIVFNMELCRYVSSAGLRAILMLGKQIKKNGGHGVLANLTEDVKEVMEMTGFDHIFKNYPSVETAIEALKNI